MNKILAILLLLFSLMSGFQKDINYINNLGVGLFRNERNSKLLSIIMPINIRIIFNLVNLRQKINQQLSDYLFQKYLNPDRQLFKFIFSR